MMDTQFVIKSASMLMCMTIVELPNEIENLHSIPWRYLHTLFQPGHAEQHLPMYAVLRIFLLTVLFNR